MICADFLAGVHIGADGDAHSLASALTRTFQLLDPERQQCFLRAIGATRQSEGA
jgi:Ser/Thr protein kinase RdoA (MazF antagonist)